MPDFDAFKSPATRPKRLSQQDFAAKYGASPEDMERVKAFAAAHGLTVVETHAARRTVVLSGSVAQMSDAFAVELGRYHVQSRVGRTAKLIDETYRGRDGFINVPEELAPAVVGVFGLDNRRITKRNLAGDPPNTTTLTVPEIVQLYDFPTNSASGQTVAVFSEGGYLLSDIQEYYSHLPAGYTVPNIVDVSVDSSNGSADIETTQDICIASTVAQGAQVAVYFTTYDQKGWVDAISRMVHPDAGDPDCSVMTNSFYVLANDDDTSTTSANWVNAVTAAYSDAAMQQKTMCVASGDTGSDSGVGDGKAHVQYPASDPWVLSCGGTTVGNVSGTSFNEYVWNDTIVISGQTLMGATGGGVSYFFPVPSYQQGAGVPASANGDGHVGRGVPDVAANASWNSGYYPVYCVNAADFGYPNPYNGNGTSASAPLYAGLIAVMNAALPEPVGFLNPLLYELGNSVVRDINPPPGPTTNALNGAPGYTAGPGWDACTGWGVIDGNALLAELQNVYTKDCIIITDRSTFGKDEVDALLKLANPAVIPAAFYIEVDGFKASDLGITAADLTGVPSVTPTFSLTPPVSGMTIGPASALAAQIPSLPPSPQRFTWTIPVTFTDDSGFVPGGETVTLTATIGGVSGSAQLQLVEEANPYEVDGPVSWLSTDVRVFQAKAGESWFNSAPLGATPADASTFVQSVITNLNANNTAGQTFDSLPAGEDASALALYQVDSSNTPIFNFALARVRYQALTTDATNVRVFFRLCPALSVSVDYDQTTTYRRYTPAAGQPIPLLGLQSNNIVTIPFFAEPRVDTTSVSMDLQTDAPNVQTIYHNPAGNEVDAYFGCWLDINQPNQLLFPLNPTGDGPYSGTLLSILQLIRNQHQCLLAEIAFDPEPIPAGSSPALSDKLAQRNLSLVASDNPGDLGSRRIPNTFEIRPTAASLPQGSRPDEMMINWGNTPVGSISQIYLPDVSSDQVLKLATEMYGLHRLTRVDDHTIGTPAGGITYVPIPSGAAVNFPGLLTVDLPAGVRRGQEFSCVVHQITNASGVEYNPPPPPTRINNRNATAPPPSKERNSINWRTIRGSFQVSIPVGTAETLLPSEQRLLSVLKWIQQSVPASDRWYLVFQRYVSQIGGRVQGFGGNPVQIQPSPIGVWQTQPGKQKGCDKGGEWLVGKIAGLVYDCFGDFEGFVLETCGCEEHTFRTCERSIEEVARRALVDRLPIKVLVDRERPERAGSIVIRSSGSRN